MSDHSIKMKGSVHESINEKKKKKKGGRRGKEKEKESKVLSNIEENADNFQYGANKHQQEPNEYAFEKKPNYKYSYKAKYDIGLEHERSAIAGKRVEWEATFDRPLDEMLYPSLQFYDTEAWNRKKEAFRREDRALPSTLLPEPRRELVMSTKLYSSGTTLIKATASGNELSTPKWTVALKSTNKVKPPLTLIEEIVSKGEVSIMDQLKTRHRLKMKQIEDDKIEDDLIEKGLIDRRTHKKNISEEKILSGADAAILQGDFLYEQLGLPSEERGDEYRSQTKIQGSLPAYVAYESQKRALDKVVPTNQLHTMEGLLYYQVRNSVHGLKGTSVNDSSRLLDDMTVDSHGLVKLKDIDSSKHSSPPKKIFNRFLRNLQQNFADDTKEKEEEESVMHSLDASVLDSDLTKIQRAVHVTSIGFDYMDLLKLDVDSVGPFSGSKNLINKRLSQDALVLSQLRSGVIPEMFIKKTLDSDDCVIDMSDYGIGDEQCLCLADALSRLTRLRTLGLRENRLTSHSVSYLIQNLHTSLRHLDLSRNDIHGKGCKQLAVYLSEKNSVEYLDISKCNIVCNDIKKLWIAFGFNNSKIHEVMCTDNKIQLEGTNALCAYLVSPLCTLHTLNMSWNDIGIEGASAIATALHLNVSLKILDLTANSIQDMGSQRIAYSLSINKTLEKLILLQNKLTGRSCFVFAKMLVENPSMKNLDLSTNPLGEAGARALFRSILAGLKCFVAMRNCEYNLEDDIFNFTYPAADSPYTLDLSEPYKMAVFEELLSMHGADPVNFRIESATIKESPKSPANSFNFQVVNGVVVNGATKQKLVIPSSGIVSIAISQSIVIPTIEHYSVPEKSLKLLGLIVAGGKSEVDKKRWIPLMCTDIYMTVAQAQYLIDFFIARKTIGAGGLVKLDVLIATWARLLDTENMYDFLCSNLEPKDRRELVYALTFERFKFNWVNPTSHWRLNLENPIQRSVMLQLIAINNCESDYGKNFSKRDDTSQYQNWYNFRNCSFSGQGVVILDKDFIVNLPLYGILEFDYVSTTRPCMRNKENKKDALPSSKSPGEGLDDDVGAEAGMEKETDEGDDPTNLPTELAIDETEQMNPDDPIATSATTESTPSSNIILTLRQKEDTYSKVITDDQFYTLIEQMHLSFRVRASGSAAIFLLMELQLASTKYYFPTSKIVAMLDFFSQDSKTQARVVITLFSRVWDLHNFDYVMKQLDLAAQHEVFLRIGVLNIVNPLKPNLDFVLPLAFADNRILVHSLIEISASDSGDQICEDPRTELSVVSLYGSSNRLLKEVRQEVMRFSFCEVGERSLNVGWTMRADQVRRYLVGDFYGKDRYMYRIIGMYNEMMTAGFLARGAIDMQYVQFLKMKSQKKKKK